MVHRESLEHLSPSEVDRYAFVSYSRRNQVRIREEIAEIRSWGYQVWFDEAIRPTEEWPEEIAIALENCGLFILFVTQESVDSRNVRSEISFALDEGKSILAVFLNEIQLPPGLRLTIGNIQAVHKTRISPERYRQMLLGVLSSALGQRDAVETPDSQQPTTPRQAPPDLGQLGM